MQLNPNPTAQQQQVLVLLAQGKSINAAAEAVGIHRNTIANWRRSSESFRNQWQTMQYEQAMFWREEMQSLARIAVEAILKTLTDEKTPPGVRLRAAIAVLDKVTTVPPAQPDLKPTPTMHNLAQPEPLEFRQPDPEPPEQTASAKSAQSCTTDCVPTADALRGLDDSGLDDLLRSMCAPPRMHNPAHGPPPVRSK